MSKFLAVIFIVLFAGSGFGQKQQRPSTKPKTPAKKAVAKPQPVPTPTPLDPAVEKTQLETALALTTAAERATALKEFIHDFPLSAQRGRAAESLVTARAILGDEKLQANESSEGIALFKLAVDDAPTPIPDRLFNEIISKFPANLFYREQRAAGIDIAQAIEKKSTGNAKQLLSLATFYLGIERGADAKRLAEAAIAIDANSVAAYQTLGLAHRLNFDLEESANAYSKTLELDPASISSKRSLAEMKRALGKPDEAAALYREIVAVNGSDSAARTGLILSLFGAGKTGEAESEMTRSLEQNPKNLNLLAGAAYWYAANDLGEKAVELAKEAVDLEPRYIWGHIALARGLMSQKKPVEAERVLVMARQYGNFPTLEYEIASARLMSGFYREAVEELQKSFAIKDGLVQTKLGGRVTREEKGFADLIAFERKASIFEPAAADNPVTAMKLRLLFEIVQKLAAEAPDETAVSTLTDEFVKGDDKMKLHRQMYSATLLLQKNIALPKVLELVKAAVGNTDAGLEVSTPAAAVMASELYESRTVAFARNEIIVVPDVPRQTLSAILRGRIEELTGWTLYQQKSYPEAVVRLRRAISVLPDKSAWWRSSMWRLGAALEADGKDKEALDSYIQSYKTDRPSALKYGVVEALYKKVHGSTDGLEAKIGPNPLPPIVAAEPAKQPEAKPLEPAAAKTEAAPREQSAGLPSAPEIPVDTVVQTAAKTVEKTPVETDVPAASEKRVEIPVQASEIPAKVEERVPPKAEDLSSADIRKVESAQEVPETPVKLLEVTKPKVETKQPDTSLAVPEKAVEISQPEINDSVPPKQGEPLTPPGEVLGIAKPESKSVVIDGKPVAEDPKAKSDASEPPKPATSSPVPPLVEKKNDAEPKPESPSLDEKVDANVETAMPQPKPAVNEPPRIEPDEPKNLLRDPPLDVGPEPVVERKPENPVKLEPFPKAGIAEKNKATDKLLAVATDPVRKPILVISDPLGNEKKTGVSKPLFEPVIIRVPNTLPPKPVNKEIEKSYETQTGVAKNESTLNSETAEKSAADAVSSGASRVRVVDGKEIKADTQCSLELSQETVSLINGGGSLGILVSLNGEGDLKKVVAASSSPRDVEVRAEPEIEGVSGRRFYVIKSVSTAAGVFQVAFESPCGKKEIVVKIR